MSVKDHPQQYKNMPVQRVPEAPATATASPAAGPVAAVLRIATGLLFLWAFLDKAFGWGYATPAERAWVNGGSPTKGFLGNIDHGPFADMFRGWAGAAWADWLFMLGLAGIGVAVVLGVGLRIAAVSGTLMMLLMWAAEWPLDRFTDAGEPTMSTNPIIEYHVIYAIVLIALAVGAAGNTWLEGSYSRASPGTRPGCGSCSASSPSPAGCPATSPRRSPGRATRAASWATPWPTLRRRARQLRPRGRLRGG